jgi:imidazole glycerol-phosphate synthase subunit HisF
MKRKMHAWAEKEIYQRARDLRNHSTPAEDVLWCYLKAKPHGLKFRRQHPYSIYILDFYCHSLKLVIEVDGSIHNLEEVKANDRQRQQLLENDSLTILRFTNKEILNNLEVVISKIEYQIATLKSNPKPSEPSSADALRLRRTAGVSWG